MGKACVAIDIGADSGKVLRGQVRDGRLLVQEVHRFANKPLHVDGTLRWDIHDLLSQASKGISLAGPNIDSVGVDTWGVDFVLLDDESALLDLPYHYRDARTLGVMERAFSKVSREDVYRHTGIQLLPFNTLFQLFAMAESGDVQLKRARHLLMIPDYIHFVLTGRKTHVCERTVAMTTQCFDPITKSWATSTLSALGIPTGMFPQVIEPGTRLGRLAGGGPEVIAPASHDTASAVVAVPSQKSGVAWISSGTWSIVGIESAAPIINSDSLAGNFTNEGGYDGSFRVCKNVMGLWLAQQCREAWGRYTYADLDALAADWGRGFGFFDPDSPDLLASGDMPSRIMVHLRNSAPQSPGQLVRTIYESLALKYRFVLEQLEALSGRLLPTIHVIGGGSQSRLLNQITANICGRPVVAGPTEATAVGNLVAQMISLGEIDSISGARRLISDSFPCEVFQPANTEEWDSSYKEFKAMLLSKGNHDPTR